MNRQAKGRSRNQGRHPDHKVGSELEFQRLIENERRRSQRSGRPFVILTLHLSAVLQQAKGAAAQSQILTAVCDALRDTDWVAWHEAGAAIGIICTETGASDAHHAGVTIVSRLREQIEAGFGASAAAQIQISFESSASALRAPEPANAIPEMQENAVAC
jgi:hypothetical protein